MAGEVVNLQEHRDAQIDEAWDAYISASRRAQSSLKMNDGITAGKAWRAWLDLWMTYEQRQHLGGCDEE